MVSDYSIDIDLKLKPSFPQTLKINQYDRGVYLKINLFDNGEPYTILNTETPIVELALPKNKGYIISGSSIKDISGNSFRVAIDRNISLNSGEASFNVALVDKKTGTTTRKGSFKKYIKIESNSIDEGTVSSDLAVSIIETIQNNVATATAKETSLREAIKTGDLDNYVTKVSGKGLSTNDFTNAYKTILDSFTTTINNAILESDKKKYPIGHEIYTKNSANPSTYMGFGTWELTSIGRMQVGIDTTDTDFDTVGKTGGSKTHTHDSGSIVANIGAANGNLGRIAYKATSATTGITYNRAADGTAISEDEIGTSNHATTTSGTTASSSNLSPYITVYIWKRTA